MNARVLRVSVSLVAAILVIIGVVLIVQRPVAALPSDPPQAVSSVHDPLVARTAAGPVLAYTTTAHAAAGSPESLDPHWMYEAVSAEPIAQVYETLVILRRERTDTVVPLLASGWTVSTDGKTYTFTLRSGITFHAGGALTAQDVAYSFWRGMLQNRTDGPMWFVLDGLLDVRDVEDVPGDDPAKCAAVKAAVTYDNGAGTVTFHLAKPFGPWLNILSTPHASVLDREWMIEQGDWDGDCSDWRDYHDPAAVDTLLYDQMNGTGPYKFSHWAADEIELVRNESYWLDEPLWAGRPSGLAALEKVVLRYGDDATTRAQVLVDGEVDFADVDSSEYGTLEPYVWVRFHGADDTEPEILHDDGVLRLYEDLPGQGGWDAMFNYNISTVLTYTGSGALDGNGIPADFFTDQHVREGFNYAFDWDTYLDEVYGGEAIQRTGPIIAGLPGYDQNQPTYFYSPTLASEALQAAWGGDVWTHGFSLTLAYNEGNDRRQRLAENLKAGIEALNPGLFHINVLGLPFDPFWDDQWAQRLPLYLIGWYQDYPHSHNWVEPWLAGDAVYGERLSSELQDYLAPKIDECVVLMGNDARTCYEQLQEMTYYSATHIFIAQPTMRRYQRVEVRGWTFNPGLLWPNYYTLHKLPPASSPDTLVEATNGSGQTLDPHWGYTIDDAAVTMQVYEGLITYRRDAEDVLIPLLSTGWSVSPSGATYTFTIRPGVTFHAGGTLTPEDVAYSFWRTLLQDREDGPAWLMLDPLFGEYHIDDLPGDDAAKCQAVKDAVTYSNAAGTVTFRLGQPFGGWLNVLAGPWASVLDKEWMVAQGDWSGDCAGWRDYYNPPVEKSVLYEQMNGTGPFRYSDWVPGVQVELARNEDYWLKTPLWDRGPAGPAALERVTIRTVWDSQSRVDMLVSGAADIAAIERGGDSQVEPYLLTSHDGFGDQPPTLEHADGTLRLYYNLPGTLGVDAAFNYDINTDTLAYVGSGALDGHGIPPDFFTDQDARKGFIYAFDYATWISDVYGGEAIRRTGPIIAGLPGYDQSQPTQVYSPTLATQAFQAAWGGQVWTNGFSMTLAYNEGNMGRQRLVELLKEGVEALNPKFHINVLALDWDPFWTDQGAQRLPLYRIGWLQDYPHPQNWVQPWLHSEGAYGQYLPTSFHDYFEPKIDECKALLGAQATTCYSELQHMAFVSATYMFMAQPLGRHYQSAELQGWYFNQNHFGRTYFYPISKGALPAPETVEPGAPTTTSYTNTRGLTTTVVIPAGAVTKTTVILFTPNVPVAERPGGLQFAGQAFAIDAYQDGEYVEDFAFSGAVTLTIYYESVANEEELVLLTWDGSAWVDAVCGPYVRDTVNNVIQVPICHLSEFALFVPAPVRVYLPLVVQ